MLVIVHKVIVATDKDVYLCAHAQLCMGVCQVVTCMSAIARHCLHSTLQVVSPSSLSPACMHAPHCLYVCDCNRASVCMYVRMSAPVCKGLRVVLVSISIFWVAEIRGILCVYLCVCGGGGDHVCMYL